MSFLRTLSFAVVAVIALVSLVWILRPKNSSPNIIVILIDTLRADHLGVYGYERNTSPNIDKFAKESLNFSRTISAASWTPPSVTSIFCGMYPSAHTNQPPKRLSNAKHQGNRVPDEIKMLPELLKTKGYTTSGLSSKPWISKDFNFDQGFDRFYYAKHMDAKRVVDLGIKELDRFLDSDNPFFLYMHFIDPHEPYLTHSENSFSGKLNSEKYDDQMTEKINLYDGEISYTDEHLGKFFEFLKSKKIYDETIVVLVSDHGEAFNEHGSFGHGFNLHIEEVRVPLFIKGLAEAKVISETVSHVDILPTLLEVTGIEVPKEVSGISLLNFEALKKKALSILN